MCERNRPIGRGNLQIFATDPSVADEVHQQEARFAGGFVMNPPDSTYDRQKLHELASSDVDGNSIKISCAS